MKKKEVENEEREKRWDKKFPLKTITSRSNALSSKRSVTHRAFIVLRTYFAISRYFVFFLFSFFSFRYDARIETLRWSCTRIDAIKTKKFGESNRAEKQTPFNRTFLTAKHWQKRYFKSRINNLAKRNSLSINYISNLVPTTVYVSIHIFLSDSR